MGKLGAALFCFLFAVPFGGVGAFATYGIYKMIYDGVRAKEWVRVKAEVTGDADYRYTFKGATYPGDRLGTMPFNGSSDVDDFDDRVGSLFAQAREEKKPITVYVNPENPAESMVDRQIRWGLMLFFVPFALAFGGVGVGALVAIFFILRGDRKATKKDRAAAAAAASAVAQQSSGAGFLWVFAFFWNAIAFPIAALTVPDIIRTGEWIGLFVLLFPLVGVGLLWAAIAATVQRFRRGRARIHLASEAIRVGGAVQGHVAYSGGVKVGELFVVRLVCLRHFGAAIEEDSVSTHWNRLLDARAEKEGEGEAVRVPFRIEIPAGAPPTTPDDDEAVHYTWQLEVKPQQGAEALAERRDIEVLPALAGTKAAAAQPLPAPTFDTIEKLFGGGNTR